MADRVHIFVSRLQAAEAARWAAAIVTGTPELAVALFSSLRLPASHATALCLTHSAYTCPIKSPHLFAVPRLLSSAMAADPPQAMTVGSS